MYIKLYKKRGSIWNQLKYIRVIVYCKEYKRYNTNLFLKFIENILSKYLTDKIIMILDNARNYCSKLIQAFLMKKDRLELLFLTHCSL